jgi:hypothetical protein
VTSRWARLSRGWFAALFATALAATSHVLAGGAGPSLLALVLAVTFSGFVCVSLTAKALSPIRLAIAVGASQFAFHSFFGAIGGGAPVTPADPATSVGAHSHLVVFLIEGSASTAMAGHHTNAAMWAGHAIAAILTIVILRHGEKAFWALIDLAALAIRSLFVFVPPTVSSTPPVVTGRIIVGAITPRILILLRTSLLYRGPPVLSIA